MPPFADHYDAYYTAKIWALVPALYRELDAGDETGAGPLREMVARIGAQAAILRRSLDRMWEDQSIETSDDWLIPYIGDLLATNLVPSLDERGRRLDVANTIYYRRRSGTGGILEEIAHDITGWDARVVEFFRRLSRTRHGLDPEIGEPEETDDPSGYRRLRTAEGLVGRWTGTQIGGFADLRNAYGASRTQTAFDEFFHTADLRAGRGLTGWQSIPGLGVFLWRLYSFGVVKATPVPCPTAGLYAFDPTGRRQPLFAASSRSKAGSYGGHWTSPAEWQLPTPIASHLYAAETANLYPLSVAVFTRGGVQYQDVDAGLVTVYPELGTFQIGPALAGQTVAASYHYGFPSPIGAGPYDRRVFGEERASTPSPETLVDGGGVLPPLPATGTVTLTDSLTYAPAGVTAGLQSTTLRASNRLRPLIRLNAGADWVLEGAGESALAMEGVWVSGADVVITGGFDSIRLVCCTTDPGTQDAPPAVFERSVDGRDLLPTRIWVEADVRLLTAERCVLGPIRTRGGGVVETLELRDCTVQGIRTDGFGAFQDVKDVAGLARRLHAQNDALAAWLWSQLTLTTETAITSFLAHGAVTVAQLETDLLSDLNALLGAGASLYDPGRFAGIRLDPATQALAEAPPAPGPDLVRLNRLLLEGAYPVELADLALGLPAGTTRLERCTVVGATYVHRLEATGCVLDGDVLVEDAQHGCVRFSAWVSGSALPQQYESVEIPPGAAVFTSRDFGRPGYCQLRSDVDRAIVSGPEHASISEGGPTGSEMGAYAREMNAIKRRSLLIKFQEYMPLGLSPVLVEVT